MWEFALFAFVAIISWAVYSKGSRVIKRNGKRLPRPPGTLPFAGYGLWFLRPRYQLLDWFAEIQPKFGLETYELAVPTLPPAVIINDPKNLEYVLKNNELFVKGEFFRSNSWDLFANGILNSDGELWRIQRKAGLRFFSNSNLQYFIDDVLPALLKQMTIRLESAAKANAVIDLQSELLELTTRFMGKIAYDMELSPEMPFSQAFDYASSVTANRFTNPLWRVNDFLQGFKFKACLGEIKTFGLGMVNAAMDRRSKSAPPRPAPVPIRTMLIDSLLEHISAPDTVADAAVNFLSAGRDTTAQSLTWTIYSLLRHPKWKEELLSSISGSFPSCGRGSSLPLSYDVISGQHTLPHAQAIFAEALRLNPAVPFEIKESTAATTLPDGTDLPAGSVAVWIPYSLARSPDIWGTDAANFDPNRWLEKQPDGTAHVITRNAFENPVFNAGPRMCIGKRMAEVFALRVLVQLMWEWDIEEIRGPGEIEGRRVMAESLTAPMQGGLPVKLRRARPSSAA